MNNIKDPICRICLSSSGHPTDFRYPCKCDYPVHFHCLNVWRKSHMDRFEKCPYCNTNCLYRSDEFHVDNHHKINIIRIIAEKLAIFLIKFLLISFLFSPIINYFICNVSIDFISLMLKNNECQIYYSNDYFGNSIIFIFHMYTLYTLYSICNNNHEIENDVEKVISQNISAPPTSNSTLKMMSYYYIESLRKNKKYGLGIRKIETVFWIFLTTIAYYIYNIPLYKSLYCVLIIYPAYMGLFREWYYNIVEEYHPYHYYIFAMKKNETQ